MKPEVFFLKYAFPCSFVIKQRGEITETEFNEMEEATINEKPLSREFLEKVFFRAFERIDKLANKMGKKRWDLEVIKKYFIKNHNEIIDEGMYSYAKAPDSLKELCKVHKGTVVEIKENVLIVEYGKGKRRPVLNDLVPIAKKGDKVTIHYGYAVEKL